MTSVEKYREMRDMNDIRIQQMFVLYIREFISFYLGEPSYTPNGPGNDHLPSPLYLMAHLERLITDEIVKFRRKRSLEWEVPALKI